MTGKKQGFECWRAVAIHDAEGSSHSGGTRQTENSFGTNANPFAIAGKRIALRRKRLSGPEGPISVVNLKGDLRFPPVLLMRCLKHGPYREVGGRTRRGGDPGWGKKPEGRELDLLGERQIVRKLPEGKLLQEEGKKRLNTRTTLTVLLAGIRRAGVLGRDNEKMEEEEDSPERGEKNVHSDELLGGGGAATYLFIG